MLAYFQDTLPRNLQYSPRNTDTHIMYKNTLAPYTLMHSIYFLSIMTLHRAYLPFLPTWCNEPQGPAAADEHQVILMVANGFWQENARELFKVARQMMDLAATCLSRHVLVENCLLSLALYNACLVGI